MPETKAIAPHRVADIVGGYVAHNKIAPGQLADLISTIHRSLAALGQPAEPPSSRSPAVAINRSYGRDFVICLDCGWRGQVLRRHLATRHALSPREYRSKWGLKATHPLIAP